MAIETIITQVAVLQGEIAGVRQAFDNPPSNIHVTPCFVNFMAEADSDSVNYIRKTHHLIKMQLYVSKQVTPEGEKLLRPFITLVLAKFDANITLNGTCDYSLIKHWASGVLTYGRTQYLGISFDLEAHEILSAA
ncbi:unnamed protein product, partial [marine sediment metagenome]